MNVTPLQLFDDIDRVFMDETIAKAVSLYLITINMIFDSC